MLFYDDFPIGHTLALGPRTITAEEIIEFATEFDPQPFHLNADAPESESVGGLIASGWHTCAIVMRMMCDAYLLDTASLGSAGLDTVRWREPVRPGDTLSGEATVSDKRLSEGRAGVGIVTFAYRLQNQHGRDVITMSGMGFVRTEPAA
ncbi:MAG: MaoC family dehydratase [Pseudomonadota bacterium]